MILAPLLVVAQALTPGQSLQATCAGQFATVVTSLTTIEAQCVEAPPPPPPPSGAIIVDEASIGTFDAMPREAAAAARVLLVNRSVGANINDGLTCLGTPYDQAANACKRFRHPVDPAFDNAPEVWTGTYDRARWEFWSYTAIITPFMGCVTDEPAVTCVARFVDERPGTFDVVLFLPSYLLEATAAEYVDAMRGLRDRHPGLTVALATSSLPRNATGLSDFNTAVRAAALAHGFPLLDVARIESHDQTGRAWFDNRDGVPYASGNCAEDYPDDGVAEPAIAPHYTRECDGGHLGNPDVGKIRVAKGMWLLVGQILGWRP